MTRRIAILGATGSIGTSALDLIERSPELFSISAVTAATKVADLADIARRSRSALAVIGDERLLPELRERLAGTGCRAEGGRSALVAAAAAEADLVIGAIVGCAGLEPVMAAVEAGRTVALANKEALVTAGALMTEAAKASGATILPVDSEHNAIFQCLACSRGGDVSRIILTASGGPFRTASSEMMASATPSQAIAHPTWSMGAKISVDSATLMNKGLELIEAHFLFGLPSQQIDILIHPRSVIHSLVEFVDGSVLAQLGSPDMRIPIAYALAWPKRMPTPAERLDLAAIGSLAFESPDDRRFPALRLARQALEAGGAAPIVLNAANEVAVDAFLAGAIPFPAIAATVADALDRSRDSTPLSIADVLEIDRATRSRVGAAMKASCA
ncbi:1-deoxy-D-xylulose-5-phosphate reductoisomerase [Sphingomonas sp.]|uniref:1-deoxy-D-xylulose-5-phosphate reductoisomerase n=1 Tax=Sphingomonas sp. TaxID=28214 RepID=UPI0025D0DA8B|nr:1-deoxy-D-xylulose-5-phosphate reductoisomerase [Sphingomonas sp.]MBV9527103.1 1-deoxy-D-xylulose-5-phosphate reductoisomerase [Sphingomonas sp.]